MGRTQHEGVDSENAGALLGRLSLGNIEKPDVGMPETQNMQDISYDYTFMTKNTAITEKFILELLSLPEVQSTSSPGKLATEDNGILMNCDARDFTITSGFPKGWVSKSEELQAVKDFISIDTAADVEKLSDSDLDLKNEDLLPISVEGEVGDLQLESFSEKDHDNQNSSEQQVYTHHNLKGIRGAPIFKEIRTRRRREFHKIHTRRSRAKLNEKMDLLRRVLPEPPAGLVVKSKAQIIDYAISVLAKPPLNQLETECALADKE